MAAWRAHPRFLMCTSLGTRDSTQSMCPHCRHTCNIMSRCHLAVFCPWRATAQGFRRKHAVYGPTPRVNDLQEAGTAQPQAPSRKQQRAAGGATPADMDVDDGVSGEPSAQTLNYATMPPPRSAAAAPSRARGGRQQPLGVAVTRGRQRGGGGVGTPLTAGRVAGGGTQVSPGPSEALPLTLWFEPCGGS